MEYADPARGKFSTSGLRVLSSVPGRERPTPDLRRTAPVQWNHTDSLRGGRSDRGSTVSDRVGPVRLSTERLPPSAYNEWYCWVVGPGRVGSGPLCPVDVDTGPGVSPAWVCLVGTARGVLQTPQVVQRFRGIQSQRHRPCTPLRSGGVLGLGPVPSRRVWPGVVTDGPTFGQAPPSCHGVTRSAHVPTLLFSLADLYPGVHVRDRSQRSQTTGVGPPTVAPGLHQGPRVGRGKVVPDGRGSWSCGLEYTPGKEQ